MNRILLTLFTLIALCALRPALASDDYQLTPDSLPQPGVPKGEVHNAQWKTSKIFPGTVHDYAVYVPKQYDPSRPACVMIFQDGGGGFNVPTVFDNLIFKKEMPVTVAIMINPGVVPSANPNALPRFNRSHEYDSLTDDYARFLIEEILPEVGKTLNLSKNPDDRALCGASSGGICAFTAAWQRPDQFHRVASFVGSFTDLQGGNVYNSLIRKYEPRPLRVFLQDGTADQDIYSGSWYLGNQDVNAALKFAGNDVKFVVGDGGHSGRHGASILPDVLRWLWRDYPAPIKAATETRQPITALLAPNEGWQELPIKLENPGGMASDAEGNVYFADADHLKIQKIAPDGTLSAFAGNLGQRIPLAFGPDGRLYVSQPLARRVVAYDAAGKVSEVVHNMGVSVLTLDAQGNLYAVEPGKKTLWRIGKDGKRVALLKGDAIADIGNIVLTPDQTLLCLSRRVHGKFIASARLTQDGRLDAFQDYFDLVIPYGKPDAEAGGMVTDTNGWLYVASAAGIQVLDQAGRVNGIIANPGPDPTWSLAFGGPNRDLLYACDGKHIYRRKLRVRGVQSYEAPIKPPAPRL
ncbi:MAG TPA: alpha/beta hydrolase-fold protein [Chthonomonadaceae bacterium]|nr:alpha/beta hydrolase-fold protein [Chthonomonadaceae bacterium]